MHNDTERASDWFIFPIRCSNEPFLPYKLKKIGKVCQTFTFNQKINKSSTEISTHY